MFKGCDFTQTEQTVPQEQVPPEKEPETISEEIVEETKTEEIIEEPPVEERRFLPEDINQGFVYTGDVFFNMIECNVHKNIRYAETVLKIRENECILIRRQAPEDEETEGETSGEGSE